MIKKQRHNRAPLTIRGVTYKNAKQAAIALGVTPQTISQARIDCRLETAGLGLAGNRDGMSNRRETIIRGVTYATRKDAAAALGVSPSELSSFILISDSLGIDYRT